MEQESKKSLAISKSGMPSLQPNLPIKIQDQQEITVVICDLLDRIAKLYQIPHYDFTVNSILLAEWILEEYQHHDLELVTETLRKPPVLNDQTWRLTPDTLKNWIDLKRIERETERQRKESRERQETEPPKPSPEDQKNIDVIIEDFKKTLLSGSRGNTAGWQLIADQIKKEDKLRAQGKSIERAESTGYIPPSAEYLAEKELRRKWMTECHDIYTGKPNENFISWEEYKMM